MDYFKLGDFVQGRYAPISHKIAKLKITSEIDVSGPQKGDQQNHANKE